MFQAGISGRSFDLCSCLIEVKDLNLCCDIFRFKISNIYKTHLFPRFSKIITCLQIDLSLMQLFNLPLKVSFFLVLSYFSLLVSAASIPSSASVQLDSYNYDGSTFSGKIYVGCI